MQGTCRREGPGPDLLFSFWLLRDSSSPDPVRANHVAIQQNVSALIFLMEPVDTSHQLSYGPCL